MTLHRQTRSESKALVFDIAQQCRFGHVFSKETLSLKSFKTIKHTLSCGIGKNPQNLCLWLWWKAAKEITVSHEGKNLTEKKSSPCYLMCGKNNRQKFIEKAGTGEYIPSDFVLLPIKLVCSHLFTKDNRKKWFLQRRIFLSFRSSWS